MLSTNADTKRAPVRAWNAWSFFGAALLALGLAGLSSAQGQPAGGVEITIADELVLPEGDDRLGKPQRDESGSLITRPGDVILYTLAALNGGIEPAYDVEIVDPIPQGAEYVLKSAGGESMTVTYSIDGGNFYQPEPILFDFRRPDGVIEQRPVPGAQYTHIKWRMDRPIPPGSRVTATFRVRVSLPNKTEETDR